VLDGAIAGPDADGDGLGDSVDPDPANANNDQDGDGYPDSWEVYSGTDPLVANPPPPGDEIYVVLPEGGAAVTEIIPPSVPLSVRTADVYFLIDTTGSMSDEINNLAGGLAGVIAGVSGLIPDVQYGAGHFRDFAGTLVPYEHLIDITTDTGAVQTELNALSSGTGSADLAESTTAALHAVATGADIGCSVGAAPGCAAGRWGWPCWRDEAQSIIVLITDHEFHNGVWDDLGLAAAVPGSCYEYSSGGCTSACLPLSIPCPSLQTVVTELSAAEIKVVGIWSGTPNGGGRFNEGTWGITYPDYNDAIDIWYTVTQTGSTDGSGVPFLYGIASDGTGLGAEVVNGIDALVSEIRLDAIASWTDPDPTGPDTSVLVNDVDPTWCEDCISRDLALNTAFGVWPGTGVEFTVTLENAVGEIPIQPSPQELEVLIEIRSDKGVLLGERIVHVLVPGTSGLITAPTLGRYWHDFEKADSCLLGQTVHWERLYVDMDTPPGTAITFAAMTSNDSDFPGPPPLVPVPLDANNEGDVQGALLGAGQSVNLDYLRIEATLTSGTPGDTPVLHSMTVRRYCLNP
jgi:hypothetical protein